MIKLSLDKKDARRIKNYLDKIDRRTTAFFRGTATHAARLVAMQINQILDPEKDPLSKEYSDGVRTLYVKDASIVPREERGKFKKLTYVKEEHWAAIAIRVKAVTGKALASRGEHVVIKIKSHFRNPAKHKMARLMPLLRYGPWTIETIPWTPKHTEAMVLYSKVTAEEHKKVYDRNLKDLPKTRKMLSRYGIVVKEPEQQFKESKVVEDLEYYSLRREFGMVAGKKAIWKPILRLMKQKGAAYLLQTNKQLWRSLFDPSYGGYGMLGRFTELEKQYVLAFKSFQDKVRP